MRLDLDCVAARAGIELRHNLTISMGGLAYVMMLGASDGGGSQAPGNTMPDFFYMGLQATADRVGRVITSAR
jgi:hypothetical protein